MGWRDRDYAKWTDEERRRFLGGTAATPTSLPRGDTHLRGKAPRPSRNIFAPGAGLAIAASAAIIALGHFPTGNPIVPALQFSLPSIQAHPTPTPQTPVTPQTPQVSTIQLPSTAQVGSFLTLYGQLPAGETGTVSVEGSYAQGPWSLLAAVPATGSSYSARVQLTTTGLLNLRITYPDGHTSAGDLEVVP